MSGLRIHDTLTKISPPGKDLKRDLLSYRIGLLISFFYSWFFLIEYRMSWFELHTYGKNGELVLRDGAKMPPFSRMISGYLNAFYVLAICMVVAIGYNYWYHRKNSKSVYLMKRLPNKWEYHKRCIILPLMGMALAFVMAGLMSLVYYGIYIYSTPAQCLPL